MKSTPMSNCPQCERSIEKAFKFCPNCGMLLAESLFNTRLRQVLNFQRKGETWKSMKQLKELAHDYPRSALVRKLLANVYFHMGLLDWAVDFYRAAIEIDPDYIDAHYDLGVALYHRARVKEAIREFQIVLKLDPDYHAAHYRLGLCHAHLAEWEAAIHHLLESTVVTPEYVMAHYHLGVIYYKRGNFEKAATSFERVLQEDPEDAACAQYLELLSSGVSEAA